MSNINTICIGLPTNRACENAIKQVFSEAIFAVGQYPILVCVLIIDTSDDNAFSVNSAAVSSLESNPSVTVRHLSVADQTSILRAVLGFSKIENQQKIFDDLLPNGVSYGAATNRLFLLARYFGCDSVHRRDSDGYFQKKQGETIFPVEVELAYLSEPAQEIKVHAGESIQVDDGLELNQNVCLVGGSYLGEWSMDVSGLYESCREAFYTTVGLCMPSNMSEVAKKALVDDLFVHRSVSEYTEDKLSLGKANGKPVDMCNVAFWKIHESLPVPNAIETVGSDYFLIAAIHCLGCPSILHNRHIENQYTPERKSDEGFLSYQKRIVKFYLYMTYLYKMGANIEINRSSVRSMDGNTDSSLVAELIEKSVQDGCEENKEKLDKISKSYRLAGGAYSLLADWIDEESDILIERARRDILDFSNLVQIWPVLMASAAQHQTS